MGDQYCMIGPYKEACARTEVEEADYPPHTPYYKAVQVMRDQGFKVNTKMKKENQLYLETFLKIINENYSVNITLICTLVS